MRNLFVPIVASLVIVGCTVKVGPPPAPPPPPPPPPPVATAKPEAPKPHPMMRLTFPKKADGSLELPGPVVFKTGSDQLEPVSDPVLEVVDKYMKQETKVSLLRVEGHTDNAGKEADNQSLSEKRALAVARWLVAKGVDCHRVLPVGFGQSHPVAGTVKAQTDDEKAQNRRVAFVDAALDGKPIANMPVDGGGKNAGDPCK